MNTYLLILIFFFISWIAIRTLLHPAGIQRFGLGLISGQLVVCYAELFETREYRYNQMSPGYPRNLDNINILILWIYMQNQCYFMQNNIAWHHLLFKVRRRQKRLENSEQLQSWLRHSLPSAVLRAVLHKNICWLKQFDGYIY